MAAAPGYTAPPSPSARASRAAKIPAQSLPCACSRARAARRRRAPHPRGSHAPPTAGVGRKTPAPRADGGADLRRAEPPQRRERSRSIHPPHGLAPRGCARTTTATARAVRSSGGSCALGSASGLPSASHVISGLGPPTTATGCGSWSSAAAIAGIASCRSSLGGRGSGDSASNAAPLAAWPGAEAARRSMAGAADRGARCLRRADSARHLHAAPFDPAGKFKHDARTGIRN